MKKRLLSLLIVSAMLAATGCAADEHISSDAGAASTATSTAAVTTTAASSEQTTTAGTAATSVSAADTSESALEATTTAATTTAPQELPETTDATSATTAATTTTATTKTTTTTSTKATTATTASTTTTAAKPRPEPEEAESFSRRYEAEAAKLGGGLSISDNGACSGGKMVEKFESDRDVIEFTVDIPTNGMYDLTFCSAGIGSYKENNILLDGGGIGVFQSQNGVFTEYVVPSVSMTAGRHSIRITKSWGWMQLDYIEISTAEGIDDKLYDVTAGLANPNAAARTVDLYEYLRDSYGKLVISGQVCDDGIYGREFTAIHDATGEYPAMLGLDMMDYTPSRVALGAGSDAVDRAIEFGKKGGIVTFCWHWNAPTEYMKSGNDENGNPRWWGAFYTRNTNFDIAKVMNGQDAAGKAAIDRDIAEIAKQLNRLDDAGVPVLWRPLHEGSGGWFWWGAKGADAYKKLWVYMYEQLTYKYECNNLIWVYNGQAADWYPGDEYVDIVGEDIYPGERVYSPQTAKFTEASEYSEENKIVALTENGCLFDIEQAVQSNTMWAWFNTWCGEFVVNGSAYSERYTEKDMLKKVYTSEYVITLDELDW